jgi:heat shock protein HslJ
MRLIALPVLLVGVLLTGCADRGPDGAADPPAAPATDPVALIGIWEVTSAGEEKGAVLRLDGDGAGLSLWRRCGTIGGSWRADGSGLFVGDASTYSVCEPPPADKPWTPAWLARVTGYRLDGAARELLDAGGQVVARLLPAAAPAPADPRQISPDLAKPPVVTDKDRQALGPAAPLPAGLTPATAESLAGRWGAADGVRRPGEAYLELNADGGWSGSDGCNGERGRWVAGAGGTLLATSGPATLMACDNHPAGSWLYKARRAAIDGDQLILFDAAAKELGRLERG